MQLLRIFLKDRLENGTTYISTQSKKIIKPYELSDLEWKSDKVHLVELALGLYYAGKVIGRYKHVSFQSFCMMMGNFFNVDLSSYSTLASSIYIRKKNYSVFFSEMTTFLNDFAAKR